MFTPVETILGAFLLHQATSSLLLNNGSILGMSGILGRSLQSPKLEDAAVLFGMALCALVIQASFSDLIPIYEAVDWSFLGVGGILTAGAAVGWGTKVSRIGTGILMLLPAPGDIDR
jgi:uncharacterized protein